MAKTEVDTWFEDTPVEQAPVLQALREAIKNIVLGVIEEMKWGRPCYANEAGLFCYLHTTKGYAVIGFEQGASLRAPDGLLEGTGKAMRHVKLRAVRTPPWGQVLDLIKQAAWFKG